MIHTIPVPQLERCSREGKISFRGVHTILTTIFSYCRFGFGGAKFVFGGCRLPWLPVVAALYDTVCKSGYRLNCTISFTV